MLMGIPWSAGLTEKEIAQILKKKDKQTNERQDRTSKKCNYLVE